MISGFCGETTTDHEDTLSLLRTVRYDQAFMFAYSQREKTHAHRNYPYAVTKIVLLEICFPLAPPSVC
jgi:tRNA A37 methylthiotransferase MiaB